MLYVGAEEGKGLKLSSVSGFTPLFLFPIFLLHVFVSIFEGENLIILVEMPSVRLEGRTGSVVQNLYCNQEKKSEVALNYQV